MTKDVQVKNYQITFERKPVKLKKSYQVEVRALTEEQALEQAYSRIGSKHRIPRGLLKVTSIKEISAENIRNSVLREIATNDDLKIETDK